MGNKNIKPCPFCGSAAFSYTVNPPIPDIHDYGGGYVECSGCTAIISGLTEEQAIEAWNRRAEDGK